MNTTASDVDRANPLSCVTTNHRQDALDQLRIQRGGGLVEEHHLRRHRQRPGDRHPLLLSAPGPVAAFARLVGSALALSTPGGTHWSTLAPAGVARPMLEISRATSATAKTFTSRIHSNVAVQRQAESPSDQSERKRGAGA
jgi:hypothetical protein